MMRGSRNTVTCVGIVGAGTIAAAMVGCVPRLAYWS
jgi:hypothetical protein